MNVVSVISFAANLLSSTLVNMSKLDNLSHSKSRTNPQVACNNQQVLQQVAQLVVQQVHS